MPYVTSVKTRGARRMTYGSPATFTREMTAYTGHDLVYSHRTGLQAEGAKPSSEEVYTPPKGNIVEQLVYRRQFIERKIGQILTTNTHKSRPAQWILGDQGHEFGVSHVSFILPECSYATGSGTSRLTYTNPVPRVWPSLKADGSATSSVSFIGDTIGFFSSRANFPYYSSISGSVSESTLNALAANSINRINPLVSKGSIFATLFELARGDVPGILTNLRRHFDSISRMKASGIKSASQALGSEYLNNVFGWSPIIRDIQTAIDVLTSIDSLLFPSDSSRRSFKYTVASGAAQVSMQPNVGYFQPLMTGYSLDPAGCDWSLPHTGNSFQSWAGSCFGGISWEDSLWTTARFATGMTPNGANNAHLDRAIDLLGLKITPSLVWELTPWSWLIDWFLNIGTVIENLSSLGLSNTILNYAYSTYRRKSLLTVGLDLKNFLTASTGNTYQGGYQFACQIDQKVRIPASPFGFGIAGSSLSASQLAILSALGLARMR